MHENYMFSVPEKKKTRVIVHTDCKNEADDQFALVHHLLTPKFIVRGIIAAHFEARSDMGEGRSMLMSYEEIQKILNLMGLEGKYGVYKGAEKALDYSQGEEPESYKLKDLVDVIAPKVSEGAEFIIKEALKDDERPLYIACLGSLTDIASAYLMEPGIADKMTVIWIGGNAYPVGGFEFNLLQDIPAANLVFASDIALWQIPSNAYKKIRVSLAELQCRVQPFGEIGKYLFEQMVDFNNQHGDNLVWPHGESWELGDQATISVLLNFHEHDWEWSPAPLFSRDMYYIHREDNRPIRIYNNIDTRLTMEDFYCKLKINFSN